MMDLPSLKRLMITITTTILFAGCVVTPATPPPTEISPYDACSAGELCAGGLTCTTSTLPAGSSFTGAFCTAGCNTSADCPQVPENQTATCVNGQCYLQCPTGGIDCPYGQACFTFDSNVGPISLCSP
jgi:hypothetical protein